MLTTPFLTHIINQRYIGSNHEFVKNEVHDAGNRAIIGAIFASQPVAKKEVNVLYATNSPGEIDRYLAKKDQVTFINMQTV